MKAAAAKSSVVEITNETVRARCWRSIRTLRRFTRADLVATAQAKDANVEEMLRGLIRAGYIRVDRANRPGAAGRAFYALARDPGPRCPIVREDGTVIDPNRSRP